MKTPVTTHDPSLTSWLHISSPINPLCSPCLPALPFSLMQLPSQHPVHFPLLLLLLRFKLLASTLDLAPGLIPLGHCASVAPSMDGPILGQGDREMEEQREEERQREQSEQKRELMSAGRMRRIEKGEVGEYG
ncbi:Hypothetical predicted protein [Xyrichtys novacula]|uniref:Uncharacterized protein n=1 Tax=Xyrichtys novacula TaxID=13765 RepID=A0AAV1GML5_XYRNO|nr:Hypothetical predicted protein [Xyrichtys novacula]